jgi:hypothetical protein
MNYTGNNLKKDQAAGMQIHDLASFRSPGSSQMPRMLRHIWHSK